MNINCHKIIIKYQKSIICLGWSESGYYNWFDIKEGTKKLPKGDFFVFFCFSEMLIELKNMILKFSEGGVKALYTPLYACGSTARLLDESRIF